MFRAIPLVPKILSTIYPLATQYLQSLQRERTKLYSHTWLKQPPNKPDNMFIDCYRYLYLAISKAFAKKNRYLRLFCVSLYIQSHHTEIEKLKTTNRTLLQRMRKKHGWILRTRKGRIRFSVIQSKPRKTQIMERKGEGSFFSGSCKVGQLVENLRDGSFSMEE